MDKQHKTGKPRPRRTFTAASNAEAVPLCNAGDGRIAQVAMNLDANSPARTRA